MLLDFTNITIYTNILFNVHIILIFKLGRNFRILIRPLLEYGIDAFAYFGFNVRGFLKYVNSFNYDSSCHKKNLYLFCVATEATFWGSKGNDFSRPLNLY